jgi:hypothetical protein
LCWKLLGEKNQNNLYKHKNILPRKLKENGIKNKIFGLVNGFVWGYAE